MFLCTSKQKKCPHIGHLWRVKVKVTLNFFLLHLPNNVFFVTFTVILTYWCQGLRWLFLIKKSYFLNWLATNNNFWCHQDLKMWILDQLFGQNRSYFENLKHSIFWTEGELVYKNMLKRSVLKLQFQNNQQNLNNKNSFFHDSYENNFKLRTERNTDYKYDFATIVRKDHYRYKRNTS